MKHQTLVYIGLIPVCYGLALLTSAAFVRWILPEARRAELGNGARFVSIDGIRGFLAFGVYMHHCLFMWSYSQYNIWLSPPHNFQNQFGKTSVAVFFMITSFLFWGRVVAKGGLDTKNFFISRLYRIYPLYLFATTVICVAVGFKTHWTAFEPLEIDCQAEAFKWLFVSARRTSIGMTEQVSSSPGSLGRFSLRRGFICRYHFSSSSFSRGTQFGRRQSLSELSCSCSLQTTFLCRLPQLSLAV